MKIPYNLSDKYMKYYNEANGIYLLRKKLKKNPDTKIINYILYISVLFFIYYILFIVLARIFMNMDLRFFSKLFINLGSFMLFIYVVMILDFFIKVFRKKISREGILEINEEGILDKAKNDFQIGFSYEHIKLIVITDNLIVFFTDIPVMIMVNNENLEKDKIINKIKKFSDVQLIDATKN